ncbi:ferritin-like domain-containing protein [Litorimonas sp.]|jgi:ferritin-like metal-binding protein YciE|uniref:YciE/YciF ferroxidase family protein n=1 Tax=Litorimonas sp. TaxID=1892381 RepID=UPI003A8B783A
MPLNNLKDLYIAELKDIYSANKQSKSTTKMLAKEATDTDLVKALERGVEGVDDGMKAMESILDKHGHKPSGEFCKGMEGLIKEAKHHVTEESFGDSDVKDAMIVTQYQRMEHYAIAGYGCLHTFARRLGLDEDAKKIKTCLDATKEGDVYLSGLAESEINKAALAA